MFKKMNVIAGCFIFVLGFNYFTPVEASTSFKCQDVFSDLLSVWSAKGRAAAIDKLHTPGLYDTSDQWVLVYDTKGTVHGVVPERELKGMNFYDFVAPNGVKFVQEYIKTMPKGGLVPIKLEYFDEKSGLIIPHTVYTSPLQDAEYFIVCSET